ncbi:MAG: DNA gyrase inhibitor YacG [Pseudomonadales bacterium]
MTQATEPPRIILCPTCQKRVKWTPTNVWRPFCSERCQLIDLGAWADESYRIEADPETSDEPSELGDDRMT